jgi:2-keto-4-pentenoate hydratase/2-oxohepta-3-ene-1,7-dioic acid hydratase in catechol pathway
MQFATIVHQGQAACAVMMGNGALSLLRTHWPPLNALQDVLQLDEKSLPAMGLAADRGAGTIAADSVQWVAPLPNPPQMLFVALNNSAMDQDLVYRPDFPAYFPKLPSALTGHGRPIDIYPHYGITHPEPELGVVIARGGYRIPLSAAMDHVFGYTVVNDITSVGMRKEDVFFGKQLMPAADGVLRYKEEHFLYQGRYKNADGFAPMGPYVIHKSRISDPMNLKIKSWIDGELLTDDSTRNLHFTVAEVISWISHHSTLRSGDIISLGTALHPAAESKPLTYANLNQRGEVVTVEIEAVGVLSNPVRRLQMPDPREYFSKAKRFRSRLPAESSV